MTTDLIAVRDVVVPAPTLREGAVDAAVRSSDVEATVPEPAWRSIPSSDGAR